MNRTAVGLIAILLLVVGTIAALRGPSDGSAAGFAAGCIRVGLVLGALWLALPQLKSMMARAPRWLVGWFVKRDQPGGGPQRGDNPPPIQQPRPKRPRRRP